MLPKNNKTIMSGKVHRSSLAPHPLKNFSWFLRAFVPSWFILLSFVSARAAETPLIEHVRALAAAEMQGRLAGTEGERLAADYLVEQLERLGAQPLPGASTFEHPFVLTGSLSGMGINVIGYLPPTTARDDVTTPTMLLVGAHYDHLGDGRTVRSLARLGEIGHLHPGADDNASGVAVVLGVGERLALRPRARGVILAFWSAEEDGLQGTRAFGTGPSMALDRISCAINLDQVGRMRDDRLYYQILGPSRTWDVCLNRAREPLSLELVSRDDFAWRSDAETLGQAGIPTLALYTGNHDDTHRPTDTVEKVNAAGLETVAALVDRLLEKCNTDNAAP